MNEMKAMKLTKHQTRVVAGLRALTKLAAPATRHEIGQLIQSQTVQLKTMLALQAAGLATPEYDLAVFFMQHGFCQCGCDRWWLTDAGVAHADALNVRWDDERIHQICYRSGLPFDAAKALIESKRAGER